MKSILFITIAMFGFSFGDPVFANQAEVKTEVQYLVFFSPGPTWPADGNVSMDTVEIQEHAKYWIAKTQEIEKGGPCPGTSSGMMIVKPGFDKATVEQLVAGDPAVQKQFFKTEIRAWLPLINNVK